MTKRTDGPSAAVRIRVYKRDRFMCTYCGASGEEAELEVDHIIPVAKGGSHHMSNLTTCCRKCNQAKGDRPAPSMRAPSQPQGQQQHMLVGMFVHTFEDDGTLRWQGRIKNCDGQMCLVQLFSWMTGGPTNVVAMRVDEMYSDKVKLYPDQDSWIEAHLMYEKRKRVEYERNRKPLQ